MDTKNFLTSQEIAVGMSDLGVKKTGLTIMNQFILGILAGAFIAFAAAASNMAAFNLFAKPETYGLGKALAGAIFPAGLIFVIVAGAELFTGNSLIAVGVLTGKVKFSGMLRNWFFVYLGNLVGSLLIAYMMVESNIFTSGANGLAATTIKIASYKVGLDFMPALYLGIMCNWVVCIAVWMAFGAKDIGGKVLAIFFPIWLFVTAGFEHSIANMYYIPAGIWAKSNEAWVAASGISAEAIANLNWKTFFVNNLVPVTIGNVIGGCIFVSGAYWLVYLKNNAAKSVKVDKGSKAA